MPIETIDLNDPLPTGRYKFVVVGVPEKYFTRSNQVFRKWTFIVEYDGETRKLKMPLFASVYQDIILACSIGSIEGKRIEWNDEDADGCCFFATLSYNKTKSGIYKVLSHIRSIEEEEEYERTQGN